MELYYQTCVLTSNHNPKLLTLRGMLRGCCVYLRFWDSGMPATSFHETVRGFPVVLEVTVTCLVLFTRSAS